MFYVHLIQANIFLWLEVGLWHYRKFEYYQKIKFSGLCLWFNQSFLPLLRRKCILGLLFFLTPVSQLIHCLCLDQRKPCLRSNRGFLICICILKVSTHCYGGLCSRFLSRHNWNSYNLSVLHRKALTLASTMFYSCLFGKGYYSEHFCPAWMWPSGQFRKCCWATLYTILGTMN